MSTESNKAVAREYIEQVWNARRLDLFERYISEDVVHHDTPGITDRESMKNFAAMALNGFPDIKISLEDEIAVGDRVVQRQSVSGTQQGELLGIPATGKHATWSGIWIFRVEAGKIVELWGVNDALSMMQQLGVIPAMEPSQ